MDPNAKQQVVERLKSASNVLVTVSNNPSVDALAAAIGFSLLLSKLGKHATAVFSGAVPPAIEFLQPGNRFDKDVTGLRDFIIALDKDKADKLRYKVEDNVVKIFITPYRTTISQADLRFEEGDFNVDAVVALGVQKREDLDNAIKAHGRILHDASVMTVNAGDNTSSLGAVDWQDPAAGSLSEMLVSVTESFGSGLLDEQMSTAFLTGIVAETERFSNPKTSPKVMTMAAQLMAAGANQQLIATNLDLQPAPTKPASSEAAAPPPDDSQISIPHDDDKAPVEQNKTEQNKTESSQQLPTPQPAPPPPTPADAGSSDQGSQNKGAPHEKTLQELESEISNLAGKGSKSKSTEQNAQNQEQPEPNKQQPPSVSGDKPKPITDSYNGANAPATPTEPTGGAEQNANKISNAKGRGPRDVDDDPTLGGTFNATSERAHEDNVADLRKNLNAKLLSHPGQPLKEEEAPPEDRPTSRAKDLQPLHQPPKPQQPNQNQPPNNAPSMPSPPTQPQPQPSPPPPPQQPESTPAPAPTPPAAEKAQTNDDIEAARKAVEEAVSSEPFNPANNPTAGSGSMPMQQQDPSQPVTPSEIAIDDSGNLRLPGTPPSNQESNGGEGGNNSQNFQMPQPPAGQ